MPKKDLTEPFLTGVHTTLTKEHTGDNFGFGWDKPSPSSVENWASMNAFSHTDSWNSFTEKVYAAISYLASMDELYTYTAKQLESMLFQMYGSEDGYAAVFGGYTSALTSYGALLTNLTSVISDGFPTNIDFNRLKEKNSEPLKILKTVSNIYNQIFKEEVEKELAKMYNADGTYNWENITALLQAPAEDISAFALIALSQFYFSIGPNGGKTTAENLALFISAGINNSLTTKGTDIYNLYKPTKTMLALNALCYSQTSYIAQLPGMSTNELAQQRLLYASIMNDTLIVFGQDGIKGRWHYDPPYFSINLNPDPPEGSNLKPYYTASFPYFKTDLGVEPTVVGYFNLNEAALRDQQLENLPAFHQTLGVGYKTLGSILGTNFANSFYQDSLTLAIAPLMDMLPIGGSLPFDIADGFTEYMTGVYQQNAMDNLYQGYGTLNDIADLGGKPTYSIINSSTIVVYDIYFDPAELKKKVDGFNSSGKNTLGRDVTAEELKRIILNGSPGTSGWQPLLDLDLTLEQQRDIYNNYNRYLYN